MKASQYLMKLKERLIMSNKIFVLTLNPAVDIHIYTQAFEIGKEAYIDGYSEDAAGKGINVSKYLNFFGDSNLSVCVLGKNNSNEFEEMLKSSGIDYMPFYTEGTIRKNITVHTDCDTRLSQMGFAIKAKILDDIYAKLYKCLSDKSYFVFSGSVPQGISKEDILTFLTGIKATGAKIILDSNSIDFDIIKQIKPFFIKPNEDEIKKLAESKPIESFLSELSEHSDSVLITLGKDGAILSNENSVYKYTVPQIKAVSCVGAGDCTIASFLHFIEIGMNCAEAVKNAIAVATAKCMCYGTSNPNISDIKAVYNNISIIKIK